MKKTLFLLIPALLIILNTGIEAGSKPVFPGNSKSKIQKTEFGIKTVINSTVIEIQFYDKNIIRIFKYPEGSANTKKSVTVITKPVKSRITINEDNNLVNISTADVKLTLDMHLGTIKFFSPGGNVLLNENGASFKPEKDFQENTFEIKQDFQISADEGLYGLGQFQEGIMNWRNKKATLIQRNMDASIPVLVSSNGYGIFWDNYSHTEFVSSGNGISFWSNIGDQIDYYFILGKNIDGVIAGVRELTGKVPMLPKWAFGYWQSKERYKSRNEVMSIASEYRKRNIPIDVIVQDWQYWGKYGWSSMLWDESTYPDPKGMLDSLHNVYNIKMMISIWPMLQKGNPIGEELASKGYLYNNSSWNKAFIYDAYNEEARNIYWKHVKSGLMEKGIDGLWMDATEPEVNWEDNQLGSKNSIISLGKNTLGSFARYLNTYSLYTCSGVYDNQRKYNDKKRVMILTRSAFAGQQRTGAITWSGDIGSTYNTLRNQISGGLNFSITGNPYWNTDIGGFFPSGGNYNLGVKDSAYRELYVRWFQFGTFCPIMRSHGTSTPREMWQFGNKGEIFYDALYKFDCLRYRILPYIYSTAFKMTLENYTLMRALAMDFPNDKNVLNINNEYMFGQAFLVSPVTDSLYTKRINGKTISDFSSAKFTEVYLPGNADWYDFWTGEKFTGGTNIKKEVPIDIMPLYVKAGSIIPLGSIMQYSNEKKNDTLEIRVYTGKDGQFNLYEDEGDNYNYEKGKYSLIAFKWNEGKKLLSISGRKGNYQGIPIKRVFNIFIIDKANGLGIEQGKGKLIVYKGKEINIK